MINKPNNWESVQASGTSEKLPAGAYVVEIQAAEVKTSQSGYEYLDMCIDVCEGEFTGFYRKDFDTQFEPRKWRGHYRQGTPRNDKAASFFKSMITAIEESNSGYQWNWDERSLIGKKAGCLIRDEEWESEKGHGWSTAPFMLVSADKVRAGKYATPKPKPLPEKAAPALDMQMPAGFENIKDEDIPF